jgi:signal transduction histidine kinase
MLSQLSQSAGEAQIPEYVATNLKRIQGTARELTRAMDEIVWAVNPQHDTLDSLASYLSRFAYDFLSAASIRCRLDVPVQLPAERLTAEVRHNLFLAFKETLHNIVSHANASEVRITLRLDGKNLCLTVEDNGQGFLAGDVPAVLKSKPDRISQGNGLVNVKRRLEEIHGVYEIQSVPGRGTTVKFDLPIGA